jgi:hypothetical protein
MAIARLSIPVKRQLTAEAPVVRKNCNFESWIGPGVVGLFYLEKTIARGPCVDFEPVEPLLALELADFLSYMTLFAPFHYAGSVATPTACLQRRRIHTPML